MDHTVAVFGEDILANRDEIDKISIRQTAYRHAGRCCKFILPWTANKMPMRSWAEDGTGFIWREHKCLQTCAKKDNWMPK